jgi:hypothetical protein
MNQNVRTTDNVQFTNLTATGQVTLNNSQTRPASLATLNNYHTRMGGSDVYLNVASLDGTYGYQVALQSGRNSDNANFGMLLNPNGGNITVGQYTALGYTLGVAGTGYFTSNLAVGGNTYLGSTSQISSGKVSIWAGGAGGVGWSTGLNIGDASNYTGFIQDAGVSRWRNFGTGGYDWYNSSASTQLMSLSNAGILFVSSEIRTPIFRDNDNTAFYLDAASTSYSLRINGGIETTAPNGAVLLKHSVSEANAWLFQENAADWGLYWFNTGTQAGQVIGDYTTVGAELFGFRNATTTNAYNPPDSWTGVTASTFSTWMLSNFSGYLWTAGTQFSATDMRAPIFRDSADPSNYYLDPNSRSILSSLQTGGGISTNTNTGATMFGMKSEGGKYLTHNAFGQDGGYNFPSTTYVTNNSNSAAGNTTFRGNGTYQGHIESGRVPIDATKTYKVSVWMRTVSGSPVCYLSYRQHYWDSVGNPGNGGWGNPYFYSGVPSTSWTEYTMTIGPAGSGAGYTHMSGVKFAELGWLHNYTGDGAALAEIQGFKIEEVDNLLANNTVVLGDLYASRFLDNNDSSFLLDPTSTSRLTILTLTSTLNIPNNALISVNGEPDVWGARFRTTTSTTNLGAALKNIIWTGGGSTEGFAISGVGTGGYALEVRNDGIVWARNSFRAPSILSDYWYDSGGTFVARAGSGAGTTRHINLSTSTTDPSSASVDSGITWGARSDSQPYYLIYNRLQNYNGNYNKLTLAWHTGIHIGAEAYYGGTRIYNNSPFLGTEIASFGRGDNYVRSEYGILSPIYYDISDTGYFLDPSNNGNGLRVYGMARIGGWSGGNYNENIRLVDAGNNYSVITFGASGDAGAGRFNILKNPSDQLELRNVSSTTFWYWDQGGIAYSTTSVRAPLFYDRDNTNYYIEPYGYSELANLGHVMTITKLATSPNSRALTVANNQGDNSWGIVAEFRVNGSPGTDRPSILFSNGFDSQTWSCGYGYADSAYFRINHDHGFRNGSWGVTDFYVDRGGNSYSVGSSRAPIFYDQDNTGYYLNPNATFNLNLNSGGVTFNGDTSGIHVINAEGVSSNVRVGAAWGRPGVYNSPYFCIGAESFIEFRIGNVQNGFVESSYLQMAGSLRAPIFYDSNDTGYYADPNGTSYFSIFGTLKMRADTNRAYGDNSGWWTHDPYGQGWGKPYGSFRSLEVSTSGNFSTEPAMFRIHQWGSGSCEWWKPQGTTVYLRETPGGGGSWFTRYVIERYAENNESFRAPIFYDTNNTGYYIDPNGFTEIFGGLRMSGGHGNSTIRNRLLASNNGAGTGLVHMQWWCSEPGNTWDWGGFGYNVDNTYHDGSGPYYFSRPNTSFGQAYFRFSTAGNAYFYNTNTGGSRVSTMDWYTDGTSYAHNYLTGGNSLRAPIFYDSNDTGYYVNPNGTSRIGGLQISGASSSQNEIRFFGVVGDNPGSYNHAGIFERIWRNGDESELLIFKGNDPDVSTIHDRLRLAACGRVVFHSYNTYGNIDDYMSASGTGNINGSGFFNGNDLYVTGNVVAYYSDERLKNIIGVIPNALDKIINLRGFYYTNNETAKKWGYTDDSIQLGLSAQEVQKVFPEVVTPAGFDVEADGNSISGENYLTVQYDRLIPVLVEAIKELKGELDLAKAEINQLREEISKK